MGQIQAGFNSAAGDVIRGKMARSAKDIADQQVKQTANLKQIQEDQARRQDAFQELSQINIELPEAEKQYGELEEEKTKWAQNQATKESKLEGYKNDSKSYKAAQKALELVKERINTIGSQQSALYDRLEWLKQRKEYNYKVLEWEPGMTKSPQMSKSGKLDKEDK